MILLLWKMGHSPELKALSDMQSTAFRMCDKISSMYYSSNYQMYFVFLSHFSSFFKLIQPKFYANEKYILLKELPVLL